jgi:hypothetical protein
MGLAGACNRQKAVQAEAILRVAMLAYTNSSEARLAANAAAGKWVANNKSFLGGRVSAGLVTSFIGRFSPQLGSQLAIFSSMGKAMEGIENGATTTEQIIQGMMGADLTHASPTIGDCSCQSR